MWKLIFPSAQQESSCDQTLLSPLHPPHNNLLVTYLNTKEETREKSNKVIRAKRRDKVQFTVMSIFD